MENSDRVKEPTNIDYIRATCEACENASEYIALWDMTQLEFDILQLVRYNRVKLED
jgi:hypothetical protein